MAKLRGRAEGGRAARAGGIFKQFQNTFEFLTRKSLVYKANIFVSTNGIK